MYIKNGQSCLAVTKEYLDNTHLAQIFEYDDGLVFAVKLCKQQIIH